MIVARILPPKRGHVPAKLARDPLWTFPSGSFPPTNSSADVFRISSNSSGQIVDWLIVVVASAILNDNSISTASVTNVDQATDVYFNTAKNSTAGSWRMSIVPTPEPASLITLSFGLVMTAVRRVRLL